MTITIIYKTNHTSPHTTINQAAKIQNTRLRGRTYEQKVVNKLSTMEAAGQFLKSDRGLYIGCVGTSGC